MSRPRSVRLSLLSASLVALTVTGCTEPDATAPDTDADGADDSQPVGTDLPSDDPDQPDPDQPDTDDSTADIEPGLIPLLLETRTGTSSQGWSIDDASVTDQAQADLLLSSTDCGARGRWVTLESDTVEFCLAADPANPAPDHCGLTFIEVGGSEPDLALGDVFFIRTATADHPVELIDRTDTPMDWYEADDLSFEVLLELTD